MRYGVILPGGSGQRQLEQAVAAERAGWDGVFVWETGYGVDAWSLLAGMAVATERVRLGTMLTPLPWRRPWKLASQVATVDQLSGGRAILAVGVGAVDPPLPSSAREETDVRVRASMMDEGIDLMRALWGGDGHFGGTHYDFDGGTGNLVEVGRPVQDRVPIWVVGAWPRPRSMRRVLRCDGVVPQFAGEGGPADLREMRAWLAERGAAPGLDVISEGESTGPETVRPWADAGATWWLETRWGSMETTDQRVSDMTTRIEAGPPA
ncbi:LLM class flavin-dependent oxidoreductase [Catenuloplanes japonicus]|uniref:LLM class flavin-dependent oxidoreductase n=1 Tax=Catenuloplanes japonicus TaxID=33876 RepID=UPI000527DA9F|nr:LLM class flavin-dependent oxidoreductase [Catenuloplanes japonicus]